MLNGNNEYLLVVSMPLICGIVLAVALINKCETLALVSNSQPTGYDQYKVGLDTSMFIHIESFCKNNLYHMPTQHPPTYSGDPIGGQLFNRRCRR